MSRSAWVNCGREEQHAWMHMQLCNYRDVFELSSVLQRLECSPPDELEASPAGSRSDDYVLAFLWLSFPFSAPTAQTLNYFGLLLLQQLAWAA